MTKRKKITYWVKYVWRKGPNNPLPHSQHITYLKILKGAKNDIHLVLSAQKLINAERAKHPDRTYLFLNIERHVVTKVVQKLLLEKGKVQ